MRTVAIVVITFAPMSLSTVGAHADGCVCRKLCPFDLMTESLNAGRKEAVTRPVGNCLLILFQISPAQRTANVEHAVFP
jgi:hypothetical protein